MRPVTYGRKSSKRHVETTQRGLSNSLDDRPRKRSKTVVETVEPIAAEDEEVHETRLKDTTGWNTLAPEVTPEPGTRSPSPTTPSKAQITYLARTSSSSVSKLAATPTLPADDSWMASNPATPKKPAKDLSQIFDISAHSAISRSGNGLAKRMLSRSRTESSLESINAGSAALKAKPFESLSTRPHSQSGQSPRKRSFSRSASPITAPLVHNVAVTHARTYAGQSRSFLIPIPTSQIPAVSQSGLNVETEENPLDEFEPRESYTDLRTRWGVDNSEDDPYPSRDYSRSPSPSGSRSKSPGKVAKGKARAHGPIVYANGLTNDLKSITELRSKGESRRFLDEVGYLFEGLEPSGGLAVRRASALEVVTKLCSPEFARKAKAADLHIRIWTELISAGAIEDKILACILSFFAALIARDPASLQELANNSKASSLDIIQTLSGLLGAASGTGFAIGEREKDPLGLVTAGVRDAELRMLGITRAEKALLTSLASTISKKSGLFPEDTSVSNRLLLSHALAAWPPSALSSYHFTAILASLRSEIALIATRLSAYISGLPLLPLASPQTCLDMPSFQHIENCLRLMDSYLLGQWHTNLGKSGSIPPKDALDADRKDGLADELVSTCVAAELMARDSETTSSLAQKCTESALRALLSLTQDDKEWCQSLIVSEMALLFLIRTIMQSHKQRSLSSRAMGVLGAEDEDDAQSLDRICLALGVLTNLVQALKPAKNLLGKTLISVDCIGKRACIIACDCHSRISALNCLAQVYVQLGNERTDPGADFLRGHLAVLFGLLMRDNTANQKEVLRVLAGSTDRQKLSGLAQQAGDFVGFYAQLTARLSAAAEHCDEEQDEPPSDHLDMERISRNGNGHIAEEVVNFLQQLSAQMSSP